jgi:hypothetical protein
MLSGIIENAKDRSFTAGLAGVRFDLGKIVDDCRFRPHGIGKIAVDGGRFAFVDAYRAERVIHGLRRDGAYRLRGECDRTQHRHSGEDGRYKA